MQKIRGFGEIDVGRLRGFKRWAPFPVSKSEKVTYGYVVLHLLLHAAAINL